MRTNRGRLAAVAPALASVEVFLGWEIELVIFSECEFCAEQQRSCVDSRPDHGDQTTLLAGFDDIGQRIACLFWWAVSTVGSMMLRR